jgi:hypothetical protein
MTFIILRLALERDPDKFLALLKRLNDLLERKEYRRLNAYPFPESNARSTG